MLGVLLASLILALCVCAQPADQGLILFCFQVENGTAATPMLEANGLPPPNDPSLLVGFECERFAGGIPCDQPFPPSIVSEGCFPFNARCLCCGEEELAGKQRGSELKDSSRPSAQRSSRVLWASIALPFWALEMMYRNAEVDQKREGRRMYTGMDWGVLGFRILG
ncbi:hypothetical protein BC834DRAFT_899451 [Gloeopeniophorella convolvens]|nr:hypothetical protein BC834DRAFT_899451 [Gloeopeniophorella convolvens]